MLSNVFSWEARRNSHCTVPSRQHRSMATSIRAQHSSSPHAPLSPQSRSAPPSFVLRQRTRMISLWGGTLWSYPSHVVDWAGQKGRVHVCLGGVGDGMGCCGRPRPTHSGTCIVCIHMSRILLSAPPPPQSHFLLLVRSFHAICCCGRSSGFVDSSPLLPLLPLSWRPAATFCRTTPNSTIITTTTPTPFPSSREVRAQ